jgi:metal-sulfur cluster biosynthetic enzyme
MDRFSSQDLHQVLSKVAHPEINYSLVELGMIKDVVCNERKVSLTLKLPFLDVPIKGLLIQSIKENLAGLDKTIEVKINIEQMSQKERDKFTKMAKEGWKF